MLRQGLGFYVQIGDGQTWEVEVATGYHAPKRGGMTPVLEHPEV